MCSVSSSFNLLNFLTYKNLMYLKLNLRPCGTHGWIKLTQLHLKIHASIYPYIPGFDWLFHINNIFYDSVTRWDCAQNVALCKSSVICCKGGFLSLSPLKTVPMTRNGSEEPIIIFIWVWFELSLSKSHLNCLTCLFYHSWTLL